MINILLGNRTIAQEQPVKLESAYSAKYQCFP